MEAREPRRPHRASPPPGPLHRHGKPTPKSTPWTKILLIGCGVSIFFFASCGFLVYYFAVKTLSSVRERGIVVYAEKLAAVRETEAIPGDQLAQLDALMELARREEASYFGFSLALGTALGAIEDDEISEEESEDLVAVRDFLEPSGADVGLIEMGNFLEERPRLRDAFLGFGRRF